MRKYLALTRVLLKDTGSLFDIHFGQKRGKWIGPVLLAVIGICLLPLMLIFYVMFQSFYMIFAPAGQLAYITGLMLNVASVVVFLFSAFSAPAVFYFAKEVEYLLPMPLRPEQIIGAKFTVALLFEYVIALFVMVPMYAAYVGHLPAAALTVNTLIVFLTMPVAPLVYSTVLVMLLMRLSRFGRNRDLYNMVVGLLAVGFGLLISVFSQRINTINASQMEAIIEGNYAALNTLQSIFPGNIFAAQAIVHSNFAAQGIQLFITAGTVAVFFLLARVLYFKGVIGLSESGNSSKKMTREDISRHVRNQNRFLSYLQKEWRLLFRSPTAFMNCVLMVFLLPVMMLAPLLMNSDLENMGHILSDISFDDPQIMTYVFIIASAAGFLLAAMNLVTSTAISREGRNYFVMKYIPVSYRAQLNAKAASGLLVGLTGIVALTAVIAVMLKLPPMMVIGILCLMLPGCVALNYIGLLIDLLKPNLTWDNEQRAVKQNMNVLLLMLTGFVLSAVVAGAGLVFLSTPLMAFVVLMLLTGAIAVIAYYFVLSMGEELLSKL